MTLYKRKSFRKRFVKKRMYPKSTSSFAKKVQNIIRKDEGKLIPLSPINSGSAMTNATCYYYNLTGQIGQGTAYNQRISDNIRLNNLSLNAKITFNLGSWWAVTPSTNQTSDIDAHVRILVVYSSPYQNASSTVWTSGNPISFFNDYGTSQVDLKSCNVVYDKIHSVSFPCPSSNGTIINQSKTLTFRHMCHLKGKEFIYINPGSAQGKFQNLYLLVVPFVSQAGTGATNVLAVNNCQIDTVLTFSG